MKHCAIALKTESGDMYCYLIEYEDIDEVPIRVYEWLGDEFAYVYDFEVDSGIDREVDAKISKEIANFIDTLEQE